MPKRVTSTFGSAIKLVLVAINAGGLAGLFAAIVGPALLGLPIVPDGSDHPLKIAGLLIVALIWALPLAYLGGAILIGPQILAASAVLMSAGSRISRKRRLPVWIAFAVAWSTAIAVRGRDPSAGLDNVRWWVLCLGVSLLSVYLVRLTFPDLVLQKARPDREGAKPV